MAGLSYGVNKSKDGASAQYSDGMKDPQVLTLF